MYITYFQVHDLEFAQIENEVVQGLKKGNESLKKLHQVWAGYCKFRKFFVTFILRISNSELISKFLNLCILLLSIRPIVNLQ